MSRGKQWRAAISTEEITLPSGLTAVVRKPNVLTVLSKLDALPDGLAQSFKQAFGVTSAPKPETADLSEVAKMQAILDGFSRAVLVSPAVVDVLSSEDADEVTLDDIQFADKMALTQYGMGGIELAPGAEFPATTGTGAGTAQSSQ